VSLLAWDCGVSPPSLWRAGSEAHGGEPPPLRFKVRRQSKPPGLALHRSHGSDKEALPIRLCIEFGLDDRT
jgi:hypothetical protein